MRCISSTSGIADRSPGGKGFTGVVLDREGNLDVRRGKSEVNRFPCFADMPEIIVPRTGYRLFPRHTQHLRIQRLDFDIDDAGRADDQPGMRLHHMKVGLGVAIEVNVGKKIRRLRLDRDLVGEAVLPGEIAGREGESDRGFP